MSDAPAPSPRGGVHPYLLLTVAALNWGGHAVVGRAIVGHASPMVITCLRWLVALGILAVLARRPVQADWATLRRHGPYLLAMGALGYTGFNAVFYWSAHHTSAVNIGVIQGVTPALGIAFAFLAYRTPIRLAQAVGVAVMFAGVLVVAGRGDLRVVRDLDVNVGDLGILVASALYAGYTVALRRRPAVQPVSFFAAMAFAAFLSSVPLLGWEVATGTVQWPTPFGWLLIVFIALGPSLVAQLVYMRAVDRIGPGRAVMFVNLVPVVAALLAVLLLGETFAPYHALALALVFAGLWLAERRAA